MLLGWLQNPQKDASSLDIFKLFVSWPGFNTMHCIVIIQTVNSSVQQPIRGQYCVSWPIRGLTCIMQSHAETANGPMPSSSGVHCLLQVITLLSLSRDGVLLSPMFHAISSASATSKPKEQVLSPPMQCQALVSKLWRLYLFLVVTWPNLPMTFTWPWLGAWPQAGLVYKLHNS